MSEAPVLLDRHDRVAVLTLNRPHALNTFDKSMYAAFNARFAEAAMDEGVWALVISAAGERAFSAGVDLKALERDLAAGGSTDGYGPLHITRTMVTAKPVITAVHGHCIGEGVALALAGDLMVASRDARFSVPEARIGVNAIDIPLLLSRRLDRARAFALLTAREPLSAEEALHLGLVQHLVEPGQALSCALDLARTMTQTLAPMAVQAMKDTLTRAYDEGEAAARQTGETWRDRIVDSADFEEGRRAFTEKRAPRFTGS
jgi:enoyl-CoA hydratase/carnithine racemase